MVHVIEYPLAVLGKPQLILGQALDELLVVGLAKIGLQIAVIHFSLFLFKSSLF